MPSRRLLLLLCALLLPAPVAGQQRVPAATPLPAVRPAGQADGNRQLPTAAAVVASMVLPGAGQWLQGQSRWVPYLALEIWSWLRFRERRQESRQSARRYRDLAWIVARRVSGLSATERRDTVFEYYEALTHYSSSGAWDVAPLQDGLQPEQDTTTFNGNLWALARSLYFPGGDEFPPGSSEYERALDYYRRYGIPDRYRWAWDESSLEQQEFADLILDSDDAYRAGTRMLGVILANHVASTVDALITARLQALAAGRAQFRSGFSPDGGGARFETELRVNF